MTDAILYPSSSGLIFVGSFLSPQNYFREIVSPNVDVFLTDQGNKRHAFNAAIGLYHMVDYVCEFADEHELSWFPYKGEAGIGSYRRKLLQQCPEFGITESVALAYKHYKLRHPRASKIAGSITNVHTHNIIQPASISSRTGEFGDFGDFTEIDFTKPIHVKQHIEVESADGSSYVLHDTLRVVRDMWILELSQLGMDAQTPHDLQR